LGSKKERGETSRIIIVEEKEYVKGKINDSEETYMADKFFEPP
jgi:hypothetical protein